MTMSSHTYTALSNLQIPCPSDFSFPTHVVDSWATSSPSLFALHWVSADFTSEKKVTYAELSRLSKCAAVVFSDVGIKKGDRVLVQLPRVIEWWVVILGLMRVGAVPIPGTSLLVAKDLKLRAETSGAKTFIGDAEAAAKFRTVARAVGAHHLFEVNVERGSVAEGNVNFCGKIDAVSEDRLKAWRGPKGSPDELAIIYFTSGTTGMPKQVLLNHRYTLGHTYTGHWYRLSPGKCYMNLGDLGWAKAAYATFGTFLMGACLFVQPPPPGPFNPLHILAAVHRYPIETLCVPPTAYRSMITAASKKYLEEFPPKALNHCVSAGEPINASVIRGWRDITGITVCDGWGQTETIPLIANFDGMTIVEGSMGLVTPGFEVAALTPTGEAGVGEEGELCVRTDAGAGQHFIFRGYLKDGAIDKRERSVNGKMWYCTGDRGYKDKDNYYWFVGRADDVITSGGYRIGPFEVESALKGHPAVLESAAVASPDALRNEIVKAFVIPSVEYQDAALGRRGAQAVKALIEQLQEHCRKETSPFKYPREIEFVEELPKTVSGKILRVELRNLEYKRKAKVAELLRSKL